MATITPTRVDNDDKGTTVSWLNLASASSDVGKGVYIGDLEDCSIQAVDGTNTNTVAIEGSQDNSSWAALGAGLTLTIGAGGESPVTALTVKPKYIRPATPSANNLDVILFGRRAL